MTIAAKVCAIHQPNFFPWMGFFDKIRRADTFIFLDAVSYPRSGSKGMGSWTNRVRIQIQNQAHWIGCPVLKQPLGTPISDIRIDDTQPWRTKLLKTLEQNYPRASNFAAGMAVLEPLIMYPETGLASYNIHAIQAISSALGVKARFIRQSAFGGDASGTAMLIDLTRGASCNAYLAGGGATGYQEDYLFQDAGVELVYQSFSPQVYGPPDHFIPGLSIIDYLLHDGRPLEASLVTRTGV